MIYAFKSLEHIKESSLRRNFYRYKVSSIEQLHPPDVKDSAFITFVPYLKPTVEIKLFIHQVNYVRKTLLDKVKTAKLLVLETHIYNEDVLDQYLGKRFLLIRSKETDLDKLVEHILGKNTVKSKFRVASRTHAIINKLNNGHILKHRVSIGRLIVRPMCPERIRMILEERLEKY